jgi:uncharacterized protein YbbC (DUF1343 family)
VAEGFTVTDVPATAPTPEFMAKVGEPVAVQLSALDCPGVRFAGVALKPVMTGGLPTVTVTVAVADPEVFVAVRA